MNTVRDLLAGLLSPLACVGLGTVCILSYKLASFAWLYIKPSSLPRYHHGKPGSTWALVTGASDGIGLGFAEALLQRGFNVLMHGRNQEKLDGIVSDLQSKHPRLQIRTVLADASDPRSDIAGMEAAVKSLPGKLTILINNVGGMPFEPTFGTLDAYDVQTTDSIINLNARFPTQLTRALLPTLQAASPALILNIGSGLGKLGMPFLAAYSASKAYNLRFTQCLRGEASALGVDLEVFGVLILNVVSGRNKEGGGFFTCNSFEIASASLDRAGCRECLVWSWWRHAVQFALIDNLPYWLQERILVGELERRKDSRDAVMIAKAAIKRFE